VLAGGLSPFHRGQDCLDAGQMELTATHRRPKAQGPGRNSSPSTERFGCCAAPAPPATVSRPLSLPSFRRSAHTRPTPTCLAPSRAISWAQCTGSTRRGTSASAVR